MMQTVVNLIRTMKAFGYDVEEELFKDHKKYKLHHKIKGYRSFDDLDIDDIDLEKLDDLINMLELSEEKFGNLTAIIDSNVTAESRSDKLREYFSPGVETGADYDTKSVSDVDTVLSSVLVNETVSKETEGGEGDSRDSESDRPDRRRRSAYEEDPANPDTTFDGDPHSLVAASLLRIIPRLRDPEGNPLFGEFASRLATARSLSENNERSGKISKLMKQVRKVTP